MSVLSASSKTEDVAAQVCTHVVRFFSVASMFPGCRERMVEMPELVKNICRVFYYKVSFLMTRSLEALSYSVYITQSFYFNFSI